MSTFRAQCKADLKYPCQGQIQEKNYNITCNTAKGKETGREIKGQKGKKKNEFRRAMKKHLLKTG